MADLESPTPIRLLACASASKSNVRARSRALRNLLLASVPPMKGRMDQDLEDLIGSSGDAISQAVTDYESLEATYRSAIAPHGIYPEATNTTCLPRAATATSSSAR